MSNPKGRNNARARALQSFERKTTNARSESDGLFADDTNQPFQARALFLMKKIERERAALCARVTRFSNFLKREHNQQRVVSIMPSSHQKISQRERKAKRERARASLAERTTPRTCTVTTLNYYVIPCYYCYYTTETFCLLSKKLFYNVYTARARAEREQVLLNKREESRASERFIRRTCSSSSSPSLSLFLVLQTATFSRTPLLRSPSNSRRSRLTPTLDGSRSPRPNPPSLSRFPRLVRIVCTRLPI
jgi:hypothetical protein